MFYVVSPNFDVKWIIFPNFGQGPFPKIAGKSPGMDTDFSPTNFVVVLTVQSIF